MNLHHKKAILGPVPALLTGREQDDQGGAPIILTHLGMRSQEALIDFLASVVSAFAPRGLLQKALPRLIKSSVNSPGDSVLLRGRVMRNSDVTLQYFGHQTIHAAANGRQQHQNVRTFVVPSHGAFDGVNLSRRRLIRESSFCFSLEIIRIFLFFSIGTVGAPLSPIAYFTQAMAVQARHRPTVSAMPQRFNSDSAAGPRWLICRW